MCVNFRESVCVKVFQGVCESFLESVEKVSRECVKVFERV